MECKCLQAVNSPFLHCMPCPVCVLTQINGKKLHPSRGAFARFMLPLLAWWVLGLILYGMSFESLQKLQAPLTSLQVGRAWIRPCAAHRACKWQSSSMSVCCRSQCTSRKGRTVPLEVHDMVLH